MFLRKSSPESTWNDTSGFMHWLRVLSPKSTLCWVVVPSHNTSEVIIYGPFQGRRGASYVTRLWMHLRTQLVEGSLEFMSSNLYILKKNEVLLVSGGQLSSFTFRFLLHNKSQHLLSIYCVLDTVPRALHTKHCVFKFSQIHEIVTPPITKVETGLRYLFNLS